MVGGGAAGVAAAVAAAQTGANAALIERAGVDALLHATVTDAATAGDRSARCAAPRTPTGQAAGVAAAQCARDGRTDAERVRAELVRQGALIAAPQPQGSPT